MILPVNTTFRMTGRHRRVLTAMHQFDRPMPMYRLRERTALGRNILTLVMYELEVAEYVARITSDAGTSYHLTEKGANALAQ